MAHEKENINNVGITAGRIVYFQNEGYFTRNKKETESIKSCCEQLLKSYCKQLQQLLKAFDLQ